VDGNKAATAIGLLTKALAMICGGAASVFRAESIVALILRRFVKLAGSDGHEMKASVR